MADESIDSQLRDMAQHRGLKLVKSRRRKPGTGDFGRYGLTDDKGKPLLGVGEDGLTASADDIESYLRAGTASSWKQSAKSQPDSPRVRNVKDSGDGTKEQPPVSRRVRRTPPARAATARAPGSPPRRKAPDVPADVPAKVKLQRARALHKSRQSSPAWSFAPPNRGTQTRWQDFWVSSMGSKRRRGRSPRISPRLAKPAAALWWLSWANRSGAAAGWSSPHCTGVLLAE